jgi:hypothetical protein
MARFIIVLLIIIAVVVGAYFAYGSGSGPIAETPQAPMQQPGAEQPQGKLMSVESYVTQNISALSPIKETMGGTFYVTEIEVDPTERKGHVSYEDGHMAYEAEFTYTSDDRTGHTITSFVIKN